MTKHRSHSAAFKRQVAEEFLAGETLHGLAQRHDISRQLIRIWVGKFEAGALDDDVQAADLMQEYEAKIAAPERMVGRQALEIELPDRFQAGRNRSSHILASNSASSRIAVRFRSSWHCSKGGIEARPPQKSGTTSVVTGPVASRSAGGAS